MRNKKAKTESVSQELNRLILESLELAKKALYESKVSLRESRNLIKNFELNQECEKQWKKTGVPPKAILPRIKKVEKWLKKKFLSYTEGVALMGSGALYYLWEGTFFCQREGEVFAEYQYRVRNLGSARMLFLHWPKEDEWEKYISEEKMNVQKDLSIKAITHGLIFDTICNYKNLQVYQICESTDPLHYLYVDSEHEKHLRKVNFN